MYMDFGKLCFKRSLKTYFGMRLFLDLNVILIESYTWDFAFRTH